MTIARLLLLVPLVCLIALIATDIQKHTETPGEGWRAFTVGAGTCGLFLWLWGLAG